MEINGPQNKAHKISGSRKIVNAIKKDSLANKALWVFLDDNYGEVFNLEDQ